ncbi:MAG: AAA family ATPase [Thermoproteota archaeon]|nr:AAA family ATPase [Thermoproteota archaeon]
MIKQRHLKISVENFGPIRSGEFELKPLTIFIGANNSGKSYLALLVYTLLKTLYGRFHRSFPFRQTLYRIRPSNELDFGEFSGELVNFFESGISAKEARRENLVFVNLPANVQQVLKESLEKHLSALKVDLDETIRDYYGCEDLHALIHNEDLLGTLSIRLNEWNESPPFLRLDLGSGEESTRLQWASLNLADFRTPLSQIMRNLPMRTQMGRDWEWVLATSLQEMLWTQLLEANGIFTREAYYLPSARSGILQGWQVFASMAVQIVRRRLGLERIDVPPLTGVAGDFLQVLWERLLPRPERREAPRMRAALEILEGQIFRGEISLQGARQERPLMVYKSGSLQLPLQRVSSMVGELAPLDLWIKHLLSSGDLLIIDEPEAHLHPENQRRIARVLVRLLRAGVRILCTTHSPLILHQVSNHLLASEADPKVRAKLGFTEDDLLRHDDISAYLFDIDGDGTYVKPIPIEAGFGISEEEFVKVAEAIGDETYRLSLQPAGRSRKRLR